LLSLQFGSKLTSKQSRVIGELVGVKFLPVSDKFDRAVLISSEPDTQAVRITTTHGTFRAEELPTLLRTHRHVVVKGEVPSAIERELNRGKTRFVQSWRDLVESASAPKRLKVILVSPLSDRDKSTPIASLDELRTDPNIAAIKRVESLLEELPESDRKVVVSIKQLEQEVGSLRPDEKAIIVFHFANGCVTLRDGRLRLRDIANMRQLACACNTLNHGPLGWQTLGQLDQEYTVLGIVRLVARQTGPIDVAPFFEDLGRDYNHQVARGTVRSAIYFISLGFGGGGIIVGAIQIAAGQAPEGNDNDEPDKTKDDRTSDGEPAFQSVFSEQHSVRLVMRCAVLRGAEAMGPRSKSQCRLTLT
jgi:hypothetical protein